MRALKEFLFDNWFLKLFSLALASLLWVAIASESTSEIGLEVPLEYRNVPANSEIISDSANAVEVRLRGPSQLIRDIQSQDVSSTIDVARIIPGETIVPLTPQNIRAPFGIDVVGVTPSRVRVSVEQTIRKTVPIIAVVAGDPADGFHVVRSTVVPGKVEVQGPESRVKILEWVQTTPVDVTGMGATVDAAAELDPAEPLVRIPAIGPVRVQVVIEPIN